MTAAFTNGNGVIITVDGPGKLHIISYGSNSGLPNHYGAIPTIASAGIIRFMISHAYTFTKFTFYWEGTGDASCGIGQSVYRTPVGMSWTEATLISYGGTSFSRGDVSGDTLSGVKRDGEVTCFIVPDRLL